MIKKLFFNLWYYRDPPWDTGISPPELLDFIKSHPPGRALDLGCGTGTNGITLAKNGWQVTGIDFAYRAIKKGRQKSRREGVRVNFRVGDVTRPPRFSSPFDLILDIGCFHSLTRDQQQRYASNLQRLLSGRGSFLLYSFISDGTGMGVDELTLQMLTSNLRLIKRQDGLERGQRPSAWFTFVKKSEFPTDDPNP
jgi:cyclopropane fatty-acyl-phospholipid synthase-like methyltransferase